MTDPVLFLSGVVVFSLMVVAVVLTGIEFRQLARIDAQKGAKQSELGTREYNFYQWTRHRYESQHHMNR